MRIAFVLMLLTVLLPGCGPRHDQDNLLAATDDLRDELALSTATLLRCRDQSQSQQEQLEALRAENQELRALVGAQSMPSQSDPTPPVSGGKDLR